MRKSNLMLSGVF